MLFRSKLTAPEPVLEAQEIKIDIDELAKALSETIMKGTEKPEQPERKSWAAFFERRQ